MAKRLKRRGKTVTFSISIDPGTKKLLREIADRSYEGNVSALITKIAEQAAREEAAAELLRLHGRRPMTDEECQSFEKEIAAELASQGPQKRKRRRAA